MLPKTTDAQASLIRWAFALHHSVAVDGRCRRHHPQVGRQASVAPVFAARCARKARQASLMLKQTRES